MRLAARGGGVRYTSRRRLPRGPGAEFWGTYAATGAVFRAAGGSLEHFLTERYCLYTTRRGRLARLEIHHPAWPLQRAEADIDRNTMAEAAGIRLPLHAPLLHFARRQDVVVWPLVRV